MLSKSNTWLLEIVVLMEMEVLLCQYLDNNFKPSDTNNLNNLHDVARPQMDTENENLTALHEWLEDGTYKKNSSSVHEKYNDIPVRNYTKEEDTLFENKKRDLPMAIIIASPAAAFSIALFLCVAYCCHSSQLTREQKKRFRSITPQISVEIENKKTSLSPTSSIKSQRSRSPSPFTILAQEVDVYSPRRKSFMAIHALTVPTIPHHKRGSSWSGIEGDILSLAAPKRHSTFII